MLPRPLRTLLAATAIALVPAGGGVVLAAPAGAAGTSAGASAGGAAPASTPSPTRAPLPSATVPVADPTAPTAEEVAAQRAAADRLQQEIAAQEQAVTDARTRLGSLSAAAGKALEAYQQAVRERDDALTERDVQTARLAEARRILAAKCADLGRWASQAYRDGSAMGDYEELMTLLESESTDDLSQRMALLTVVGRVKGEVVVTVDNAAAVQREATVKARNAAVLADAAAARAEAARTEADELLAAQQTQLAELDDLLADTRDAAEVAGSHAEKLAAARALAEERRLAALARQVSSNQVTGAVGSCKGADISHYPNGGIPSSALCSVWGAPGHLLRADAAHAFDRMSRAYAERFGAPICVTDSYRTYASQVRLRASKPHLAAVPGTSNHGWGTATDLCDGIQTFGSASHRWMQQNAPLYGWFHPAWAQQGGSKPEPWHWQFGG